VSAFVKKIDFKGQKTFYKNSLEYLSDELEKLDLILKYHFEKEKSENSSGQENMSADVFISASHIENLLKKKTKETKLDHNLEELAAEINQKEKEIRENLALSRENGVYMPFDILQQLFDLGYHEIQILIIAIAPVVDSKYEKIYAYSNDSVSRKNPSIQLLYKLFCKSPDEIAILRELLNPFYPLIYWKMIHFAGNEGANAASTMFEIDGRIAEFLLGDNRIDKGVAKSIYFIESHSKSPYIPPELLKEKINSVIEYAGHSKNVPLNVLCTGDSGISKMDASFFIARHQGFPLLYVKITPESHLQSKENFLKIIREALFFQSAVFFDCDDDVPDNIYNKISLFLECVDNLPFPIFLSMKEDKNKKLLGGSGRFFHLHFALPDRIDRAEIWHRHIRGNVEVNGTKIENIVDQFHFSEEQIQNAVTVAKRNSVLRSDGEFTMADLLYGCQSQCNSNLNTMGVKLQYNYTLDDLVLPADRIEHLKEIVDQHKNRIQVLHQWGFSKKVSYGNGLCVLFSGPSGTGKTMAASIIAKELKLDVYKIDLSSIVSKYIGETEKNLSRIFSEASLSNAILFFDEADALFGKRSEVKDAHDRYANIETSYLLQKMEEYEGITILASNFRQNMDNAFLRRIHFIVEFPFPDKNLRKMLWQKMFPKEAPLDPGIDHDFLSEKMELTGGNIKNMALAAAYLASAQSENIQMKHIVKAAKREYQKLGMPFIKSEFLPYSEFFDKNEMEVG
jgi:hypothetical protein